ncbi:hypothetical protein GCM10009836_08690 [Pseudonocardia ailaonensis]|uniref:Xylan 1,4-beta-xylosidase n=1 Tax=Pseudonocardia ailaonensis TaxID=367279 RepID=A0ABN2MNW0_9PSEU
MPLRKPLRPGPSTRPRPALRSLPLALVAAALALVAGCTSTTAPPVDRSAAQRTAAAVDLGQGWDWNTQSTALDLGVTHTQDSLDLAEPTAARERGTAILKDGSAVWQNVHLMGFGTLNPEPSPGTYDWSTLDSRMNLVKSTGGRTVLTACCAPDWMKGGTAGRTDWSDLEVSPQPQYFDAFASLVAATVQRYPQIEAVQVWNELKGFYHEDENRWDYEGYTALYNKVYTAVKAVRPDVMVGGPYVVMISLPAGDPNASSELTGPWGALDQRVVDVVEYWMTHNVGADFVIADGGTATRDGTITGTVADAAGKYADVDRWLRGKTKLPIWWAEFYPDPPPGVDGGASSPASAVATLAAVAAYARTDVSTALLWGPQDSGIPYASLWTDATKPDGGQPTPLTPAWRWLVPRLAKGGMEIGRSQTQPLIAFRAPDGSAMIINVTGQEVPVAGQEPLPAWAIAIRDPA